MTVHRKPLTFLSTPSPASRLTSDESKKTKGIAVACVAIVLVILNFSVILTSVRQITGPTINYDVALSLQTSTGLSVSLGPEGMQNKQYIPGLYALYADLASIQESSRDLVLTVTTSDEVHPGSDLTIVPLVTESKTGRVVSSLALLVFAVDPVGQVRASYPSGNVPFRFVEGYLLTDEARAAMANGRLAFTYIVPFEQSSVGRWTIFVLVADYVPGASMPFLAGTKKCVEVIEPRKPVWQNPVEFFSMWLGPALATYGLISNAETRRILVQVLVTMKKNWILILGIIVIVVAFVLSNLVP